MKSTIVKLIAAALAVASLSATAATPPSSGLPPKVFNDLGVTMQSRVCGELMTSLALAGVQALQMQFPRGVVPVSQRQPVYDTAAQAMALLAMSGALKVDERLKAGEIAQAVEKMDPQVHVDTALFCQRRVAAWIAAKQLDKALVAKAYAQAQILMDNGFAHNGDSDERP